MMKSEDFYKNFERDFTSWAKSTDDIRAAFIVGSRARVDHPADEWADWTLFYMRTIVVTIYTILIG